MSVVQLVSRLVSLWADQSYGWSVIQLPSQLGFIFHGVVSQFVKQLVSLTGSFLSVSWSARYWSVSQMVSRFGICWSVKWLVSLFISLLVHWSASQLVQWSVR